MSKRIQDDEKFIAQKVDEKEYYNQQKLLKYNFGIGYTEENQDELDRLRKIGYQPGQSGHLNSALDILSDRDWSEIINSRLHEFGNDYRVTTSQLYELNLLKNKIKKLPKTPHKKMVVTRARVIRYINQKGLYCSRNVPDILNSIITKVIDNGINRVYIGNRRKTLMAIDIPFFNLYL